MIFDVHQDSRGFLWVSHEKGLTRFDGLQLRHYANVNQNGKSLSNIQEDKAGRIWVQNFTGQFFYVERDSLHYFEDFPPQGNFFVARFIEGTYLCFLSGDSLRVYDIFKKRLLHSESLRLPNPPSFLAQGQYLICESGFNTLCRADTLGIVKERFEVGDKDKPPFFPLVWAGETALLNTQGPIRRYRQDKNVEVLINHQVKLHNIVVIGDNMLWLATSAGIYAFDRAWNPLFEGKPLWPELSVSWALKDFEGNYWLSTLNQGLILVRDLNVIQDRQVKQGVTALLADKSGQGLWMGTGENSLFYYQPQRTSPQKQYQSSIKHNVGFIYEHPNRPEVLFNTHRLFKFSTETKRTDSIAAMCYAIDTFGQGGYYAATSVMSRLITWDKIQAWPSHWSAYFSDTLSVEGKPVVDFNTGLRTRAVLHYGRDSLLAGTSKGLLLHTPRGSQEIKRYGEELNVSHFCRWDAHTVYAATLGQGIVQLQGGKVVGRIGLAEGLNNEVVYRIYKYRDALWWISESGLQRYNPTDGQIFSPGKEDGLPNCEFKTLAFLGDWGYLGCSEGLFRFPVNWQSPKVAPPLVYWQGIYLGKEPQPLSDTLFWTDRNQGLRLDYSIIAFRDYAHTQAAYRLNGQDWQWQDAKLRQIQLAGLGAGWHSLELMARNGQGTESRILRLDIWVQPLPWETWWFYVLGVGGLSLGFYALYRRRMAQLAAQNKLKTDKIRLEQELQASLLSSIKSQMNPHFIFNALNTIQSYIYLNDRENAAHYLVRFSELIRLILEMSAKETVLLSEELRAIGLYLELEAMRFEDTLSYEIEVEQGLHPESIRLPSMLVQPYLENAIKHGLLNKKDNRLLKIRFYSRNEQLFIEIDDNGIGRDKAQALRNKKHQSFSSQANAKRLELLNQQHQSSIGLTYIDKRNAQGQAEGTTVILSLPLNLS